MSRSAGTQSFVYAPAIEYRGYVVPPISTIAASPAGLSAPKTNNPSAPAAATDALAAPTARRSMRSEAPAMGIWRSRLPSVGIVTKMPTSAALKPTRAPYTAPRPMNAPWAIPTSSEVTTPVGTSANSSRKVIFSLLRWSGGAAAAESDTGVTASEMRIAATAKMVSVAGSITPTPSWPTP